MEFMYDKTQLMRGSLEGCILKIIEKDTTYGYEILMQLKNVGFEDVSEGTIYPILLRLERQGIIVATLKTSPLGPKRKYYRISETGKQYVLAFYESWKEIQGIVAKVMMEEDKR